MQMSPVGMRRFASQVHGEQNMDANWDSSYEKKHCITQGANPLVIGPRFCLLTIYHSNIILNLNYFSSKLLK